MTVSSTTSASLVYDFWGFPQKYYDVTYNAPAAPELAESVAGLVATAETKSTIDGFWYGLSKRSWQFN